MEVIVTEKEYECCICGKPTKYIEINYQAPFCSDECVAEMDKKSNYGRYLKTEFKESSRNENINNNGNVNWVHIRANK